MSTTSDFLTVYLPMHEDFVMEGGLGLLTERDRATFAGRVFDALDVDLQRRIFEDFAIEALMDQANSEIAHDTRRPTRAFGSADEIGKRIEEQRRAETEAIHVARLREAEESTRRRAERTRVEREENER